MSASASQMPESVWLSNLSFERPAEEADVFIPILCFLLFLVQSLTKAEDCRKVEDRPLYRT